MANFIQRNLLLTLTIAAVIVGAIIGIGLKATMNLGEEAGNLIGFPGKILLQMFKMIVVPLITVALICGVGGMRKEEMGRIGGLATAVFFASTIVAVLLGIIVMWAVHPGRPDADLVAVWRSEENKDKSAYEPGDPMDTFLDLLRNAFTENLVDSAIHSKGTVQKRLDEMVTGGTRPPYYKLNNTDLDIKEMPDEIDGSQLKYVKVVGERLPNITRPSSDPKKKKKVIIDKDGSNVLGLVVFALTLGLIASTMGKEAEPLMRVMKVLDKMITKVVTLIVWYSPFAIIFLIAGQIVVAKDMGKTVTTIGFYLIVATCCQFGIFILQNVFFAIVTQSNPIKLVKSQLKAIAIAFATASSTATIPVNMECIEANMGVNKQISQVIIPVGATINMSGTSIHIAASCMFIAQVSETPLNFTQYVMIAVTSTMASLGAAGIPSVSLVTMAIVLTAIQAPVGGIATLIPIDWILDRLRTVNNTFGDAMVACLIQHFFGRQLLEEETQRALNSQAGDGDSEASARGTERSMAKEKSAKTSKRDQYGWNARKASLIWIRNRPPPLVVAPISTRLRHPLPTDPTGHGSDDRDFP
ncbi:unnamed protein product, partial [Mesorhabditis spiculigera]